MTQEHSLRNNFKIISIRQMNQTLEFLACNDDLERNAIISRDVFFKFYSIIRERLFNVVWLDEYFFRCEANETRQQQELQ